jgi:hypothetical protein
VSAIWLGAHVGDERRLDDAFNEPPATTTRHGTPRQRRHGLHLSGAEAFIRVRKLTRYVPDSTAAASRVPQ